LHLAQVQVWWWDCRPWGRRARFHLCLPKDIGTMCGKVQKEKALD
jgi:hypothetical protein